MVVIACALLPLVVAAAPLVLQKDPSVSAAVAVEGPPIFPVAELKPGQIAQGFTVFASARGPEPFSAEILGVMRSYLGPGEDLIIARLIGQQIERTGVISGMSGSPVYIDGKLVGAVSYRLGQFTPEPIAGITPIERMLTGAVAPTSVKAAPGKRVFGETPWGRAEPIAIPLMVSGLAPGVAEGFSALLDERGYGALMAAGSAASGPTSTPSMTTTLATATVPTPAATTSRTQPSSPASMPPMTPRRFYASGPIAGLMVDGDVQLAGIGTVTWVKGDRFLAFGHPYMGTGISTMPVGNAEIVTTVASQAGSWKLGQATSVMGRLTDDRLHAIAGTMGERARTIPVDLVIDTWSPRKDADAKVALHFDVMDHPSDTPMFAAIAIANALQGRVGLEHGGTFDVIAELTTTRGDRVVLPARVADDVANPAVPTALAVLAGVTNVVQSEFADVKLASLKVRAQARADIDIARIVEASVLGSVRAGESASIAVRLQPWHQPAREERITVKVPRGLPPGTYAVVVASDGQAQRVEQEGGLLPLQRSYKDQLAQLQSRPPPGTLSVYLLREQEHVRLNGEALPGLPPSLRAVTSGAGGAWGSSIGDARATLLARTPPVPGVIVGDAKARLVVIE